MNTQVDFPPTTRVMWFVSTEPDADVLLGTVTDEQPEDQREVNVKFDLEPWTVRTVETRNVYFY